MAEHSFPNVKEVLATADSIWWGLKPEDWEEAFAALLPIGERTDLADSTPELMQQIRDAAMAYQERYGQRFVIRAIGKTAAQILQILQDRLESDGAGAMRANAEQCLQITHHRLKRLLPRS